MKHLIIIVFSLLALCSGGVPSFRDKYLWPFSADSIWNKPIGSAAQYQDVATKGVVPVPQNIYFIDTENVYSYNGSWLNPAQPVYWENNFNDMCYSSGLTPVPWKPMWPIANNYLLPCPSNTGANFAGGIVTDSNHEVECNWVCRCTANEPFTVYLDQIRTSYTLDGDGITGSDGQPGCGGHGGSCLSGIGGSIRQGELTSDTINIDTIRHAIKFTFDMQRFGNLTYKGFVWPATKADGYAESGGDNQYGYLATKLGYQTNSHMGMGSLLAIPTSVNLPSLNLETVVGKKLGWTLQNYGGYIVDDSYNADGVPYNQGLCIEQGENANMQKSYGFSFPVNCSISSPIKRDLDKIYTNLKVVVNNSNSTIGGGGTPLQPLAPPFYSQEE